MNYPPSDWIRSLLSISSKPLCEKEIRLYTGLTEKEVSQGLSDLEQNLEQHDQVLFLHKNFSGWQLSLRKDFVPMAERFLQEKPLKLSKSCLEVLALIAYHQPLTRSEIERIRGVSLSPNILKLLFEWEWIEVCGHKEVPGKPELLRTTKRFLEEFGLQSLSQLPLPESLLSLEKV